MKRFVFKSVLACALSVGLLAACGSSGEKTSESGKTSESSQTSQQTSSSQEQTSTSAGESSAQQSAQESSGSSTADYSIKVWAAEGVKDLFQSQANAWAKGIKDAGGAEIEVTVQPVGEGDAASNMISDVQAGADLFCFAQDQLAVLRSAGALTEIVDSNIKGKIHDENDTLSYSAACVGDALVALPLTSDNGYFMYYDTEFFAGHEEVLENLTDLIAYCKAGGRTIYMQNVGSAWYNASFFMAYDCTSTWVTNSDGLFTDYEDNYNSPAGLKACKAMYELIKEDTVFVDGSDASVAFDGDAAVCVSGTWDSTAAKTKLAGKFGAAKLPTVTVDGVTGQLGCFFGCKLLGIKPQTNAIKGAYVTSLAQYFSAKDAQLARYNSNGWGPSNLEAQQDEAVQADVALRALNAQVAAKHVMQGQYPGGWWTAAATIAANLQKSGGTDAEIRTILSTYAGSIDSFING